MKSFFVNCVLLYQRIFSPDKGILRFLYPFRGSCVMFPSCSEYMILSIKKHGAIKGALFGVLRIGRCHPFQKRLIDVP